MPTVLDAFALVALSLGEPAADRVASAILLGDARMSTINLAESVDRLVRVGGRSMADVHRVVGDVVGDRVEAVALDVDTAWQATDLRARHYHRRTRPLSLPDCVALALTLNTPGAKLATADRALLDATHAEGAEVLALPDSTGREP